MASCMAEHIANHLLFTPKDMKLAQSTAAPMSTYRYGTWMSGFLEKTMSPKSNSVDRFNSYIHLNLHCVLSLKLCVYVFIFTLRLQQYTRIKVFHDMKFDGYFAVIIIKSYPNSVIKNIYISSIPNSSVILWSIQLYFTVPRWMCVLTLIFFFFTCVKWTTTTKLLPIK